MTSPCGGYWVCASSPPLSCRYPRNEKSSRRNRRHHSHAGRASRGGRAVLFDRFESGSRNRFCTDGHSDGNDHDDRARSDYHKDSRRVQRGPLPAAVLRNQLTQFFAAQVRQYFEPCERVEVPAKIRPLLRRGLGWFRGGRAVVASQCRETTRGPIGTQGAFLGRGETHPGGVSDRRMGRGVIPGE